MVDEINREGAPEEQAPPEEKAPIGGAESEASETTAGADVDGARESEAEVARRERDEYLDRLQRLQAEFENYKKRTRKEKSDTIRYANESLILKLLPAVDNFDRAMDFIRQNDVKDDVVQGIDMIRRQLLDALAEFGVLPFDSKEQPFDPTRHEPLNAQETADKPENTILEEFEKGFMMHDRVLRMAKVSISRLPAAAEPESEALKPEGETPDSSGGIDTTA